MDQKQREGGRGGSLLIVDQRLHGLEYCVLLVDRSHYQ